MKDIEEAKALLESKGYFVGKWEPIEKAEKRKLVFFIGINKYRELFLFRRGKFQDNKGICYSCWTDINHEEEVSPIKFIELPQPPED